MPYTRTHQISASNYHPGKIQNTKFQTLISPSNPIPRRESMSHQSKPPPLPPITAQLLSFVFFFKQTKPHSFLCIYPPSNPISPLENPDHHLSHQSQQLFVLSFDCNCFLDSLKVRPFIHTPPQIHIKFQPF